MEITLFDDSMETVIGIVPSIFTIVPLPGGRLMKLIGGVQSLTHLECSFLAVLKFKQTLSRGVGVADSTVVDECDVPHPPSQQRSGNSTAQGT